MSKPAGLLSIIAVLAVLLVPGAAARADDAEIKRNVLGAQVLLIWTDDYDGPADGIAGPLTQKAIKSFQTSHGFPETGELTEQQIGILVDEGTKAISTAGFELTFDKRTAISIGIPTTLTRAAGTTNWGSRWATPSGNVSIDTVTLAKDTSLNELSKILSSKTGRVISYSYSDADGRELVLSGTDADATEFYSRFFAGDEEIRGFGITYDRSLSARMKKVVIAMSVSFHPFDAAPAPEPEASETAQSSEQKKDTAADATASTEATIKTSLRACLNGLGDCPKAFSK
jgi:peptidoglycan hydrolase-like protein with peptidoglycan-binding domain